MTLDDVAGLADLMLAKKIRRVSVHMPARGQVELELDPAAFVAPVAPMANVPAEFRDPPSDEELLFRSVEAGKRGPNEAEEPEK